MGRGPAATAPPENDENISRHVQDELKWDSRIRSRDIRVSVENGIVTLTGSAPYCIEKAQAERAALRVRGTREVVDEIAVEVADCDTRDDADLVSDVCRVLGSDVQMPAADVEVAASDGWVTLRGEVEWNHQRRAAEDAVSRLAGVRGIKNLLTVRPWQRPSSEELKRKVEEALRRNCETDADGIAIHVDGDTVTLTGTVEAWCEKDVAAQVAWLAPGITSVDNRIEVRFDGRARRASAAP